MSDNPLILLINRNRRNLELLTQFLGKGGCRTITAISLEEFDQALETVEDIALALVDLAGFDPNIWERCERLRNEEIPFLIISPKQTMAIQQEGIARGARSVLVKPLIAKQLLEMIRNLI